MRVLILASYAPSLIKFRGRLIENMVAAGHEVITAAPDDDGSIEDALGMIGARYVQAPLSRVGMNPLADMRSLWALTALMRHLKPDLLISYTMKPVIYGSLAAKIARVPKIFPMVTGLGYCFSEGTEVKRRLLRLITSALYRLSLRRTDAVIFQNQDDIDEFRHRRIIARDQPVLLVNGSGVDTGQFEASPIPEGAPSFLLVARMIRDKGVFDFVEAARRLRRRFAEPRFHLLGWIDGGPTSARQEDLDAWREEDVADYLGYADDVRPHLQACSVFVLPTYLREGVPRSILEALAMGRAIITTDTPGCRTTVIDGENGFLVPPKDPKALATAMQRFVEDPGLAARMGQRSRELALERFDVRKINAKLLDAMGLIGKPVIDDQSKEWVLKNA